MTTRLYLIRHGATPLSADNRFSGGTEVDLSDEGRQQMACLAKRIADHGISAIYCSPMGRTMESAAILAQPLGLVPQTREGLREIHQGRWETHNRAEVEQLYPEEYAAWREDPFTVALQGGESGLIVLGRALPVIREIWLKHPGQKVAVVSHMVTLQLILTSLLGMDVRFFRERLEQSHASLNILDLEDMTHARLILANDISHYTDQPPPIRKRSQGKAYSAPGK